MKQTWPKPPSRHDRRHLRRWTVDFGRLAAVASCIVMPTLAHAKTPGQTYCFHGVCHRVLTVEETKRMVGRAETVIASFYDDPKRDAGNPNIHTSSGERFDALSDRTAASPIYPNGTRLLVWNPRTKAAADVRVNNSGPYHGARRLDVSRGAAERLGFRPFGVSRLNIMVLSAPTPEEALYKKGRTYVPAAGYLGTFETAERAFAAVSGTKGGGSARTNIATTAANVVTPAPAITTSSIGWDTTVRPVRSPLSRAASGTATSATSPAPPPRPTASSHRATVTATTAPSRPPNAWSATLLETSVTGTPRLPSIMTAPGAHGISIRP